MRTLTILFISFLYILFFLAVLLVLKNLSDSVKDSGFGYYLMTIIMWVALVLSLGVSILMILIIIIGRLVKGVDESELLCEKIEEVQKDRLSYIGDRVNAAVKATADAAKGAGSAVADAAKGAGSAVADAAKGAGSAVKKAGETAFEKLKKTSIKIKNDRENMRRMIDNFRNSKASALAAQLIPEDDSSDSGLLSRLKAVKEENLSLDQEVEAVQMTSVEPVVVRILGSKEVTEKTLAQLDSQDSAGGGAAAPVLSSGRGGGAAAAVDPSERRALVHPDQLPNRNYYVMDTGNKSELDKIIEKFPHVVGIFNDKNIFSKCDPEKDWCRGFNTNNFKALNKNQKIFVMKFLEYLKRKDFLYIQNENGRMKVQ